MFKHFNNTKQVLAYMQRELLDTLRDDLFKMETSEKKSYTDEDREEIASKIADIEAVVSMMDDPNHANTDGNTVYSIIAQYDRLDVEAGEFCQAFSAKSEADAINSCRSVMANYSGLSAEVPEIVEVIAGVNVWKAAELLAISKEVLQYASQNNVIPEVLKAKLAAAIIEAESA